MKITFQQEIFPDQNLKEEDIVELLLKNRNITNLNEFLTPRSPLDIRIEEFGYKEEINKVQELLKEIRESKKTVVVYSDYDADGITGGAILWETLHHLGFKVIPYVPHRQLEGYGFSIKGLENVKKLYDPAVVISVDHGITAQEKIVYAADKLGIPIIVTDHHLKSEVWPDAAHAVFHIPALSGSGVAYFFSKMLYESFGTDDQIDKKQKARLEHHFKYDYLALASIGTIADLVPLTGPSRSIAKFGLEAFPYLNRMGIAEIIKQAKIVGKKITPFEIGFVIAPRINAIGRLEHALDALRLLCTTNLERATLLAGQIGSLNTDRQELVKVAVKEAKAQMEILKASGTVPNIIVLVSDKWHEGIIGLIASKLVEEYYRPTLVITKVENGYKGSARSVPGFHLTDFLRQFSDHLLSVGGHAQAAGFGLEATKLDAFVKAVGKTAGTILKPEQLEKVISADLKIPLAKVTRKLAKQLDDLNPFGMGNPQPTFYSKARVIDVQMFGKTKTHLKLIVKDPSPDFTFPLELIAFGGVEKYYDKLKTDQIIEIVYQAEIDYWGGTERLRGMVKYLSP